MPYCIYVFVCDKREFSFSRAVFQKFLFSGRFVFSVLAANSFGIFKTSKLEEEELCLYYA
jgi:hypothetical protein